METFSAAKQVYGSFFCYTIEQQRPPRAPWTTTPPNKPKKTSPNWTTPLPHPCLSTRSRKWLGWPQINWALQSACVPNIFHQMWRSPEVLAESDGFWGRRFYHMANCLFLNHTVIPNQFEVAWGRLKYCFRLIHGRGTFQPATSLLDKSWHFRRTRAPTGAVGLHRWGQRLVMLRRWRTGPGGWDVRDTSPIVKLSFAGIVLTGHFSLGSAKQQSCLACVMGDWVLKFPTYQTKRL